MGYKYKATNAGQLSIHAVSINGIIETDSTAKVLSNVTAAAAQYDDLTVSDWGDIQQNDIIQVNGAGNAGANKAFIVGGLGKRSNAAATRTLIWLRQQRPILTAVSAVPVSPYFMVRTRFRPDKVVLTNLNTGDRHEWLREMDENTARKIAANGVVTMLADSGIFPLANGFAFHPSLLDVSQKMAYEVAFANP
ncbi:MAG: hypothetical protein GAK35_03404 [Herbaspirillum frisingense]|uniref:Uncharacterized protein n=1 Tax=Herbaspirillum frisingense TaxID=92645 RepID=A0A7V8JSX6_9BURK|nr:MAG: hypothetical protein GAK35_03404 [Herbaspirillum frisingense]